MIKKKWISGIALACIGAMLAGCGSASIPSESMSDVVAESNAEEKSSTEDSSEDQTEKEEAMAEHMAQELVLADPMSLKDSCQRAAYFADWAYLQSKENTIISPLSLNVALGLAAEGASGETAQQLYAYLGREDYTDYVKEYMTFAEGLAVEKGERQYASEYSFHYEIANSIWINQMKQIQDAYRDSVTESFRAEVSPADFTGDIGGTVKKINGWCEEKTHGMIPEIVTEQNIKPNMMAILINSLYFESPWVEKWSLQDGEFTDLQGKQTTQEMLIGSGNVYYENDKATAFGKSYYNGFEFIGILPKTEGEFSILDLDLEGLLKSEDTSYEVKARMPKLNFETSAERVEELLQSQGITVPFDQSAACFDKIVKGENLYVDSILQKCKIELDENGTKAAAVTAMMMRANSIAMEKKVKEVNLDRPFAFLIYDTVNDEILFVGKVTSVSK
ncbi:MAG: serpin family protein [Lachnospiraceae bacterium]|nr:serpin family protein [Lachnospiraceae bacterium]